MPRLAVFQRPANGIIYEYSYKNIIGKIKNYVTKPRLFVKQGNFRVRKNQSIIYLLLDDRNNATLTWKSHDDDADLPILEANDLMCVKFCSFSFP